MAFIKDYSQAPIGVTAARDSIEERWCDSSNWDVLFQVGAS